MGEIDRGIQYMKDRGRSLKLLLPFDILPKAVIIHLVYFVVFWINAFIPENGISQEFSPR